MEETKKEIKVSGAGFIVFREDTLKTVDPLMLALVRSDGLLDIPKGTIDPGENSLSAAKRECFEECSVVITDEDILFSAKPHSHGPLDVFCASTNKTPSITSNPKTGIIEHQDYRWVTEEQFCSSCLDYLIPAARHFYSCQSSLYNNI